VGKTNRIVWLADYSSRRKLLEAKVSVMLLLWPLIYIAKSCRTSKHTIVAAEIYALSIFDIYTVASSVENHGESIIVTVGEFCMILKVCITVNNFSSASYCLP
jgi:hypothetical protein